MRHRKSGRQLGRNSSHRQAMFRNMMVSLITHETIRTTLPKAKELRRFVEPMITLGKIDTVANRRRAFAKLRDNAAVAKLFVVLGSRFSHRPGGYLRILKCGYRHGDKAPMAYVQLLDQGMDDDDDYMVRSSLDDTEYQGLLTTPITSVDSLSATDEVTSDSVPADRVEVDTDAASTSSDAAIDSDKADT